MFIFYVTWVTLAIQQMSDHFCLWKLEVESWGGRAFTHHLTPRGCIKWQQILPNVQMVTKTVLQPVLDSREVHLSALAWKGHGHDMLTAGPPDLGLGRQQSPGPVGSRVWNLDPGYHFTRLRGLEDACPSIVLRAEHSSQLHIKRSYHQWKLISMFINKPSHVDF